MSFNLIKLVITVLGSKGRAAAFGCLVSPRGRDVSTLPDRMLRDVGILDGTGFSSKRPEEAAPNRNGGALNGRLDPGTEATLFAEMSKRSNCPTFSIRSRAAERLREPDRSLAELRSDDVAIEPKELPAQAKDAAGSLPSCVRGGEREVEPPQIELGRTYIFDSIRSASHG